MQTLDQLIYSFGKQTDESQTRIYYLNTHIPKTSYDRVSLSTGTVPGTVGVCCIFYKKNCNSHVKIPYLQVILRYNRIQKEKVKKGEGK